VAVLTFLTCQGTKRAGVNFLKLVNTKRAGVNFLILFKIPVGSGDSSRYLFLRRLKSRSSFEALSWDESHKGTNQAASTTPFSMVTTGHNTRRHDRGTDPTPKPLWSRHLPNSQIL